MRIPAYAAAFASDSSEVRRRLGQDLLVTRGIYRAGMPPAAGLDAFVSMYNWLSTRENQTAAGIEGNDARNLTGDLMQDYLGQMMLNLVRPYPSLEVFEEAVVAFGRYPVWSAGAVSWTAPAHVPDLTAGQRYRGGQPVNLEPVRADEPVRLDAGEEVIPLLMISSKIRISMPEFFDWLGREQLVSKGNPSSLSLQIGLRPSMNMSVVLASQTNDRFFVLGSGGRGRCSPDHSERQRLQDRIEDHLRLYMPPPSDARSEIALV